MAIKFILLADDDVDDQLFFQDAVEEMDEDIRIRTVYSGEQLMRILTKEDVVLPDLIFLDLNMPIKNGHQCLEEIRSNDKLKHIPIAIFSTSKSPNEVDKTLKAGANVYIHKPNDFARLKELISLVVSMEWKYPFVTLAKNVF